MGLGSHPLGGRVGGKIIIEGGAAGARGGSAEIRRGERSDIAEDIRAFSAYPKEELHAPMTTNLEQQNKSSLE